MNEHYKRLFITIVFTALSVYFKDELSIALYYQWTPQIIFIIIIAYWLFERFIKRNKIHFFNSKNDTFIRFLIFGTGLILVILVYYYWIPQSIFHWIVLAFVISVTISMVFYRGSILFYKEGEKLFVDYKGKFDITNFDTFEVTDGTLKIMFLNRRIEVYNFSMKPDNIVKLEKYLNQHKVI